MLAKNKLLSQASLQRGSMLLEALIGILIFSLGVLAIVGMQTTAVLNSSESKYRSDANLLANQLIGQMWISNRNTATLQNNFQGAAGAGGAAYMAWFGNVGTPLPGTVRFELPGAAATVAFDPLLNGTVTVTVSWQSPASTVSHQHVVVAQVR